MFSIRKISSLGSLLVMSMLLSGCSLKTASPEPYQVDLEIWGVFDDSDVYDKMIGEYRRHNPYIREIRYRKMAVETYKEDLLNALAAGKGPDIFMIRNGWRGFFEDKIAPAPDLLLTEKEYREKLVDVAASDFIEEGKIYGLPLSVDSLALYYNKDIFNAAGIASPKATWEGLLPLARSLTKIDQFGNVSQSAIALGTAYNINRSTDVLTALMLQQDASLENGIASGSVTFNDEGSRKALEYYTFFSSINSPAYSWNPRQHYSIDAFYEGTLAMMVNYSWHYPTIKQKNAKLNFAIAPLPQFRDKTPDNFANYWAYTVSKTKPYVAPPGQPSTVPVDQERQNYLRVHESWQLLRFFGLPHGDKKFTLKNGLSGTTKDVVLQEDLTQAYLERTIKPAARRDLIEKQKDDVVLGAFATGNLIAKNWYQGNPEAVEGILAELIEDVTTGSKTMFDALGVAENRINLLIRQ